MKNYLLTGASGFLGRYIVNELRFDGVTTLGRSPGNDIICDISNTVPALGHYHSVIHAAGKAHSIPKTVIERKEFFDVNIRGTLNLVKGLEISGHLPTILIYISSVSVYGLESGILINEDSPLNAREPYGLSKIQSEEILLKWGKKNGVKILILRLPLLVGQNAPGNLGSMVKAISNRYYFNIGGGESRKSMVMAEDVAKLIKRLDKQCGIFNLTDGYHPNFSELSEIISKQLTLLRPYNLPFWVAKIIAKVGDKLNSFPINTNKLNKLISDLTFSDEKAIQILDWKPSRVLEKFKI